MRADLSNQRLGSGIAVLKFGGIQQVGEGYIIAVVDEGLDSTSFRHPWQQFPTLLGPFF